MDTTTGVAGLGRRLLATFDRELLLLLTAGAAARVAVDRSLANLPWFDQPTTDPGVYDAMARAFAGGDWLLGHETIRMSPAYPFFLGLVYWLIGDGNWAIRVVQGLGGLVLVALAWDTARLLAGRRAALVAGGIAALFGPALFYEALLLSDAPAAMLAALALWMMVRAALRRDERWSRWLPIGAAAGLVAAFRPNALLLWIPLAAAVWQTASPARRRGVLVAATVGFVIGVSPVPVRNMLATGRPTLFAAHGGLNLYIGNGPSANGAFHTPSELPANTGPDRIFEASRVLAEQAEGRPLDAAASGRYWTQRTVAYVREHPVQWVRLLIWKLRLFWNGASLSDIEHYTFTRALSAPLALPFVQWWALMCLAVPGTLLALRPGRPAFIVAMFNLSWCAGLVLIFVLDRYRLAALSGLAVTAGLAVEQAVQTWEAGGLRRLVVVASLAAAAWLAYPAGVITDYAGQWRRLGLTYEHAGRVDEARDAFTRSLAIEPGNPEALQALRRLR